MKYNKHNGIFKESLKNLYQHPIRQKLHRVFDSDLQCMFNISKTFNISLPFPPVSQSIKIKLS